MAEATSTSAGMPALFIYIPTYNRLATLKLQLDALTAQRDAYPGPVRILVSDNASPAITDEQLSALAQEYGIEVRRNPGNIGANANIALGFIFADPEGLLWILSDDDTVSPDALSYIAEHCQGVDYDIITFYTKITEPGEFTHRWVRAWEDLHETGLISNVIYKASVFLPGQAGIPLSQHELPASCGHAGDFARARRAAVQTPSKLEITHSCDFPCRGTR